MENRKADLFGAPECLKIVIAPDTDNTSRKHAYIILTPLKPHFTWQNWGLQGYTLFFLFLLKNIDFGTR